MNIARQMRHYVTLFDSNFLPQGIALHCSMRRHLADYILWVLCVDDEAYEVLDKLKLENTRLLKLSDLETDELKRVKKERLPIEYCWTLTPFAPRFVFEADQSVGSVTYIDADIWFRKQPNKINSEFEASGKSVLITDHCYDPEFDQSEASGQFCVQYITFDRHGGEKVRQWWEERCIESCQIKKEDGKFGDQKYLEEWPRIFGDAVHVLQNNELCLAPWNAKRFPHGNCEIYHFHGLRLISRKRVHYSDYPIPEPTMRYVYRRYFEDLNASIRLLESIGIRDFKQYRRDNPLRLVYRTLRTLVSASIRIFFGQTSKL